MNPHSTLINLLLLPEQELLKVSLKDKVLILNVSKTNQGAVCPKCASFSRSIYDSRSVTIKDSLLLNGLTTLVVKKKRFFCKPCKKAFTEPLPGVLPKKRSTQRFKKQVQAACMKFRNLKQVAKDFKASQGFVYTSHYEQLEIKTREFKNQEFSESIGIDEHCFGRKKGFGRKEFVTMIVDHNHKKVREVVLGKTHADLNTQLNHIPGREKVKKVTLDLSDSYKSFVKSFFPNAELIADRFHVQRLFNPILRVKRIDITGDQRANPMRRLMNRNRKNLEFYERTRLDLWLKKHPVMNEVYTCKEQLVRFYEIRGLNRAKKALNQLIARMENTSIKELQTLKTTLKRWKTEILNFFKYRLTNARVEGFNNVAKVIKRNAYGFKSFKNYRLKLLTTCL